jgi:ribosomal protein S18 acetylase RimI-like enzyme
MYSENVIIRAVKNSEITLLQQLSLNTFVQAFGSQNSAANMEQYISEALTLEHITREFQNPNSSFFFAEYNSEIIGYLKVNQDEAQTEKQLAEALEIERIYVISEYQSNGIGALLLNYSLDFAQLKRLKRVWLGVWDKNKSAIRFYERHGFVVFSKHKFMLGQELQFDVMMKIELV